MNEGVKILLERIKTNPEEFTEGSKWGPLIQSHKMFLNEEDAKALNDALNGLMQERFTEKVMTELLAPEEDNSLGKPWYSKQGNITLSAGATQGVSLNSGAVTGTITYNDQLSHELAHIDAHNAVLKKQKKHKTLFGKLFNYS
jgi:hypothetical protein